MPMMYSGHNYHHEDAISAASLLLTIVRRASTMNARGTKTLFDKLRLIALDTGYEASQLISPLT